MRVFFGHLLESEVQTIIHQQINQLPKIDGKLVEQQNFHLTIGFIGEINKEQLIKLEDIAAQTSLVTTPIDITISQFSLIPQSFQPRVLALKILTDNGFLQLQQHLQKKLNEININFDCKPPHLTVARLKSWNNITLPAINDIHLSIKNFSLIKSDLTSTGPIYTVIKSFALKLI